MSSKRERFRNKSPASTPPDTTCTDPVNCKWDACMQQFSRIADLVQHIKETHILKGITKHNVCLWRNCPRNRKSYKNQCRLVTHLQSHTGEKLHRCPYPHCHKMLARSFNLRLHIQRHNGERPYKCQVQGCNKSFVNFAEHSQHQKTHSKQKPFACTFPGCDKRYKNQSTLNRHSIEKHTQRKKPFIETSDELESSLPIQSVQNNKNPLNKKQYTFHNERHHQHSEVEVQDEPLIAAPPEQHPYHAQANNGYLQLPFPVFMKGLPDINTIFDAQDHANYLPDNSHYTDSQSQLYSSYQSPLLGDFFQHIYNPKSLVMPSLSSMTLINNIHSHPQSAYKECIPNSLPPYEDIQCVNYKSPLTNTQQPIMSHQ